MYNICISTTYIQYILYMYISIYGIYTKCYIYVCIYGMNNIWYILSSMVYTIFLKNRKSLCVYVCICVSMCIPFEIQQLFLIPSAAYPLHGADPHPRFSAQRWGPCWHSGCPHLGGAMDPSLGLTGGWREPSHWDPLAQLAMGQVVLLTMTPAT